MRILLFLLFFSFFGFSQQKTISHKVSKGETLTSITQKYDVSISEIYNLNPKAKGVLQLNSILKIPTKIEEIKNNSKPEIVSKNKETSKKEYIKNDFIDEEHEVLAKETLYGIAKKYKVTIQDIRNANPSIELKGLEIGMKLIIPGVKESKPKTEVVTETKPKIAINETVYRTVKAKETKFGIAKEYGISVEELEKQNPEIATKLLVGFKLKISNPAEIPSKEVIIESIPKTDTKVEVATEVKEETPIKIVEIPDAKPITKTEIANQLVENASKNIGTRYKSGGTTTDGFDCSGFMIYTFGGLDIKLPRTSREQSQFGVQINPLQAQKGDLIFFSTNGSGGVNHVGLVTEVVDEEVKFIHSSSSKGVMISSNKEEYYAKRFVKINRVLD